MVNIKNPSLNKEMFLDKEQKESLWRICSAMLLLKPWQKYREHSHSEDLEQKDIKMGF